MSQKTIRNKSKIFKLAFINPNYLIIKDESNLKKIYNNYKYKLANIVISYIEIIFFNIFKIC